MNTKTLILVLTAAVATSAAFGQAVSWPANNDWNPVTYQGSLYIDPLNQGPGTDRYATPPSPLGLDLVGGTDSNGNGPFGTAFWGDDGDNLLFRIRLDDEPVGGQDLSKHVWTVFLNRDQDEDVDWALQLDNKVDSQIELVPAVSGGPNSGNPWDPVVLGDTPHAGVPLEDRYRIINATDLSFLPPDGGSLFNRNGPAEDDFFLDFAFPWATFDQIFTDAGLTVPESFGVAFATSANHININKDLPEVDGWGDPIPEPATATLLGLGAAVFVIRRRRI